MEKETIFFKKIIFAVLGIFAFGPFAVFAATTIGTDINTSGTLTVDGALKFTSGAAADYILTTDPLGNAIWISVGTALSHATTDSLPQGITNLYYTDAAVDARITLQKGVDNGLATLDGTGKIPSSQLSALAINNTYVVADQAARLALAADVGDIAVQTDTSETYVLQVLPATDNGNWILITPTASVLSVNGQTGVVNLTQTDLGLGNVENTALSTWTGSLNITTVGTILSGTWNGSAIGVAYGGTDQTMYTVGDILYASGATALSKLNIGTNGQCLKSNGTTPTWDSCAGGGGSGTLQDAYDLGATITTTSTTPIAFTLTSGDFNVSGAGSVNLTPTGASQFTSSGALALTAGASSVWSTSSGDLTLDSAAALNLGTTNATAVGIGSSGIITTVNGPLSINSYADFNSALADPSYVEGRLFYDSANKALAYYNDISSQEIHIGQEYVLRVYNQTGSQINFGQVVYISGVFSDTPSVALARADVEATSRVMGIANENISNASFGYVITRGLVDNLNTSSFSNGDALYLSPTTAGALTSTRPSEPNFSIPIGYVVKSNATTGIILTEIVSRPWPGSYTAGAVSFGANNFLTSDSTNFFWDNSTKRLGLGDNTPAATLSVGAGDLFEVFGVSGNITTQGDISLTTGGGSITATGGPLTLTSGTGSNLILNADGAGSVGNVQIGAGGAGSATPDYLALDVKSTTGDPAGGTEGYIYYNTFDNKFRCYENAAWKDCDVAGTGLTDPMTTIGDLIFRDGTNTTNRLALGTAGQILTVSGGVPSWQNAAAGFTDPMTTIGDLIYRNGANTTSRLAVGTNGQVLTVTGGLPTWQAAVAGFSDPMTTRGDIIYRDSTNTTDRLALGTSGQVLRSNGTDLVWGSVTDPSGSLAIPNYIDFTSIVEPAYAEGRLFYDSNDKALAYYNDSSASGEIHIGQEYVLRVYNQTGSQINAGEVVYINGVFSDTPRVALARADSETTARAMGVAPVNISNASYGYVITRGLVSDLDTSAFSNGDALYLSPTTAGALTSTRPSEPNFSIPIGYVVKSNATTGIILTEIVSRPWPGSYTAGAVSFGANNFLTSDSTNFFWDNSTKRLGIGDNTPAATLSVGAGDLFEVFGATGNITTAGDITLGTSGGSIVSTGGGLTLTGGGASAWSTSSGALTITSAAAATWSTTAGNLILQAGSGTVSLGTSTALTASGALAITSGGATALTLNPGGAAILNLGTANASAVSLGRTGITTTNNGALAVTGTTTLGSSGTPITSHLSATASLNFGAIDGSCANLTITVTGAATGDTAIVTPTPVAGGLETDTDGTWSGYVSAANTVTVHACDANPAGIAFNPAAQTWRADVWKH